MNGIGYGITPFMGSHGILARSSGGGGGAFVNEYSMSFDGVDERFAVGTTSLGITSAISVSAWVKIPTTNTGGGGTNIQVIACEDNTGGGQRNWNLFWRGTGYNYFVFNVYHTNLTSSSITSTGIVPNDGQWHHLLATFDGTTNANGLKLYVDGTLFQKTATSTGINSYAPTETTIGTLTGGANWRLEGNIDEVAIWNNDQSSNASSIYNGGVPTDLSSLSPLSWWRMGDGDTWNGSTWTLTDNGSGGNDATSVNMEEADRVTDVPPNFNLYSMSFDGVDEYAKGSSTFSELDGGNKFTLSMWVKPTSFAVARMLFHIPRNTTASHSQVLLRFGTTGRPELSIDTTSYYVRTSTPITLNVWNHILVCVDLTNPTTSQMGRIYINSVDATSSVNISSRTAFSTSTGAVWLGEEANGYLNPFLGNIDEFAMWVGSDERANVADIYNGGAPFDLSTLASAPQHWWRMGDGDSWDGSKWILNDNIGSYNLDSVNMEEGDRTTDKP